MMRWPTERLGKLTDILSGFAFDSENFSNSGGTPLARIRDVLPGRTSTFFKGAFDARYLIDSGDILIGMDGEFNRARWRGGRALLNQRVSKITSCSAYLDDRYLFHFLPAALKKIENATPFVTVKHLSVKQIRDISIPLPHAFEQQRIANILDKADALRAKRRAALSQLATLTSSIFFDMFGDPATNPHGWLVARLGDVISVGPQNGLYKPASEYGAGTPILRIDAFYDGVITGIDRLKRIRLSDHEKELYSLRPGEIVVNRVNSREYLGKSALVPTLQEATVFESNMMRFGVDPIRVDPTYVIQLMQTRHVRAHILRAAKDAVNQSSINQQDVKAIPIVQPPLALQRLFAQRLRNLQTLDRHQNTSLKRLDDLFASLQNRAFRGEL